MSTAAEALPSPDASKFRVLKRLADGSVQRGGLELLEGPGPLWVDLVRQEQPELDLLGKRFGLHPLALEDCAHLDQRPKAEEYGNHLFLVQHSFTCGRHPQELELHELHAFLG
ncbi:MAG: CorA family divalent cation transporter, partial [Myxococcales bacterium]